jgi:hypothetical protein
MWSILTSKQSLSIMLFSLSIASFFIVLSGLYQVGCAVATSYGKTLTPTLRQSYHYAANYILLNVILPICRRIDDVLLESEVLTRVTISVIFMVLLIGALLARVYALVRR